MTPRTFTLQAALALFLAGCGGDTIDLPEPEGDSTCPPVSPFGSDIGDIIPSIKLEDCDGNSHNLHDSCAAPVTWVALYTGW